MATKFSMALLYNKYAPALLSYVRTHTNSKEDAEDILVDVFLAALENALFATLPESAQRAWLWRVAHNKIIDQYRRVKRRQHVELEQVVESLYEDDHLGPEYSALRQEDYENLHAHLNSLPLQHQEILRLRFGQGLLCREIAERLGKQENTVRVTLSRCLNVLRGIYQREGGEAIK